MPHIIGGREITGDFNTIHVFDDDDKNRAKIEMWMAKRIGETLVSNYPSRQWGVDVDTTGLMVIITCPGLSLEKGYHISMGGDSTIQDLQTRAIMAAGEILERYGMSRNWKFNADDIEGAERYITGEVKSGHASQEGEDPLKRRDG